MSLFKKTWSVLYAVVWLSPVIVIVGLILTIAFKFWHLEHQLIMTAGSFFILALLAGVYLKFRMITLKSEALNEPLSTARRIAIAVVPFWWWKAGTKTALKWTKSDNLVAYVCAVFAAISLGTYALLFLVVRR